MSPDPVNQYPPEKAVSALLEVFGVLGDNIMKDESIDFDTKKSKLQNLHAGLISNIDHIQKPPPLPDERIETYGQCLAAYYSCTKGSVQCGLDFNDCISHL